jgi:hypothetical protein
VLRPLGSKPLCSGGKKQERAVVALRSCLDLRLSTSSSLASPLRACDLLQLPWVTLCHFIIQLPTPHVSRNSEPSPALQWHGVSRRLAGKGEHYSKDTALHSQCHCPLKGLCGFPDSLVRLIHLGWHPSEKDTPWDSSSSLPGICSV